MENGKGLISEYYSYYIYMENRSHTIQNLGLIFIYIKNSTISLFILYIHENIYMENRSHFRVLFILYLHGK